MKRLSIFIVILFLQSASLFAQNPDSTDSSTPDPSAGVAINIDDSYPDLSAILDVDFLNKGFLITVINFDQRSAIVNPAEGLIVGCLDCDPLGGPALSIYSSGKWQNIEPVCTSPKTPTAGIHNSTTSAIHWHWNPVPIATGYKWNEINDYATATDVLTGTDFIEIGLPCWTLFTRYVWAYNDCGESLPLTMTQSTAQIPLTQAPTEGTHSPGFNQVVWVWAPVFEATGYAINSIDDFSTATDVGTATSTVETGLGCGTDYTRYIWAYHGCGHSDVTILQESTLDCLLCGTQITDERDGQVYPTVLIGSQCWTAKNMNIGTITDGSLDQIDEGIIEKYCYDNSESNCNEYGGLYQWEEAMQYLPTTGGQGICPTGWHIPTDAEYILLRTFLGGRSVAGGKMKSEGTIQANSGKWYEPNTEATNSSGFTAHPGGARHPDYPIFRLLHDNAFFWSSTESSPEGAMGGWLQYDAGSISLHHSLLKESGFSVRCVRD